jgi:hypothetical protein
MLFEKNVADLISLSLLTWNHQSQDLRVWRDKAKTPEAVNEWKNHLNDMVQCWRKRQIAAGIGPAALLCSGHGGMSRYVAILTEQIPTEQGYVKLVAVTIAADGVITSTELGETVAGMGGGTTKYVKLADSLGSACSKCGIVWTSGRVGRGWFSVTHANPPHSRARVFRIRWIDAKDSDTVGTIFQASEVSRVMTWCLVLDPEQVTPEYDGFEDLRVERNDILARRAFMDYVTTSGKHAHYIQQIERLLELYRRIAAVEDRTLTRWWVVQEALDPLEYYYEGHGSAELAKVLIIENPINADGEETPRYMAASRLEPEARPPPPIDLEDDIRRLFRRFCDAMRAYENDSYTRKPKDEYYSLIYTIYDVPKRAEGQHPNYEAQADPLDLREFFQKQEPAFNDAMFAAALYIWRDRADCSGPADLILYYEHYLRLLRRTLPSQIAPALDAARPAAGQRALLDMRALLEKCSSHAREGLRLNMESRL